MVKKFQVEHVQRIGRVLTFTKSIFKKCLDSSVTNFLEMTMLHLLI